MPSFCIQPKVWRRSTSPAASAVRDAMPHHRLHLAAARRVRFVRSASRSGQLVSRDSLENGHAARQRQLPKYCAFVIYPVGSGDRNRGIATKRQLAQQHFIVLASWPTERS